MAEGRYSAAPRPSGSMPTLKESSPGAAAAAAADNLCRRSVSIFSRRGADTPEPMPPFVAQAVMRGTSLINEKQKNWRIGRSMSVRSTSSTKSNSPKTPRGGTVLNAVPPARMIHMTPLEEEMSSSPNEEILSAISENTPTLGPLNGSSPSQSQPVSPLMSKKQSTASMVSQAKSQKRRDKLNSRVGVWVDGVVHWDSTVFLDDDDQASKIAESGLAPVRPQQVSAGERPQLSVVIPGGEPLISDRTVSTILQPRPQRPLAPAVPGNIARSTPHIVQEKEVSPSLSDEMQPTTPPDRPHGPVELEGQSTEKNGPGSRASTSSSSENTSEEVSGSSSRRSSSSATSVEVLNAPATVNKKEKPLPPIPVSGPERVTASTTFYKPYHPSYSVRMTQNPYRTQRKQLRHSRSISELDSGDRRFVQTSPYARRINEISPTLSEAEKELKDKLATMSPVAATQDDEPKELEDTSVRRNQSQLSRKSSVSNVMEPPTRAPAIPKRSRKRDWWGSGPEEGFLQARQVPTRRRSETQMKHISELQQVPQKSVSVHMANNLELEIPSRPERPDSCRFDDATSYLSDSSVTQDFATPAEELPEPQWIALPDSDSENASTSAAASSPISMTESDAETIAANVESSSAERVLLSILYSLHSTEDLFNTAIINKGMYRVYKENEMNLIRRVAYNESPPAWELREWSPPTANDIDSRKAPSLLEHTPTSYMRCYRRDLVVIERLKRLILEKCHHFIRRETAFALSTPTHPNASRFNDAFWRIWCFCKIFGCNKGREDDVTGQLDWLKGGLLANNQGCVATVNTNLDFDMSSVLLNAPEHFAKANPDGLSASQLFDLTEIWTCMTTLLQPYQGRVDQARRYGVFDAADAEDEELDGNVEREEHILEEWTSYLLTMGPEVVLEMASLSNKTITGFSFARKTGLTNWRPTMISSSPSGSPILTIINNSIRTTFLKEPVSKSYEEQVARAKDPKKEQRKEKNRQRVATLAAEIKLRRQASDYKRLPFINMEQERPMSIMSRHRSTSSAHSSMSMRSMWEPTEKASHTRNKKSFVGSIPEEKQEYYERVLPKGVHPAQRPSTASAQQSEWRNIGGHGVIESSVDRAVAKIVSMGFTVFDARNALKTTDLGDGIRLDRAVELLLARGDF